MIQEPAGFLQAQQTITSRLYCVGRELELFFALIHRAEEQSVIMNDIKRDWLSEPEHRKLFDMILELWDQNKDIDQSEVVRQIERYCPDSDYSEMIDLLKRIRDNSCTTSVQNIIKDVKETFSNRVIYQEMIMKTEKMLQEKKSTDEMIEHLNDTLMKVEFGKSELPIKSIFENAVDDILNQIETKNALVTGLTQFDVQFGGILPDRYYLIGGEPGSGKTACTIDLIYRLAEKYKDQVAILFYSLEMSEKRIVKRLISRGTGLTNQMLDQRMKVLTDTDKDKIRKLSHDLSEVIPLTIVYETMTAAQIKLRTKKFIRQNPGKHPIIILDHIGLVEQTSKELRLDIIKTSKTMKSFCVDYKATSIVLTQFTKEIEAKENKKNYYKPDLKYIAESGRLRQDADGIILLWRPETRFERIFYDENPEWSTHNKIIYCNEKNRDGACPNEMIFQCNVGTNFIGEFTDNPYNI